MKNKQNKAVQRGNFSFKLIEKLKTTSINSFDLARAISIFIILILSISIASAADVVVKAGDFNVGKNLNVTGNASIIGTSLTVNTKEVCLSDGTNCLITSDTQKTTNGFYLFNDSATVYFNETQLNTTIDARGIGLTVEGSEITDGTVTDVDISDSTNLTLGQKITFALGEIIDNIVDGIIKITGSLEVTGNLNVSGLIYGNGSQLTDLPESGNSSWNESYANTKYVNKSGDTMTGNLTLPNINVTQSIILKEDGRIMLDSTNYMTFDGNGNIVDIVGLGLGVDQLSHFDKALLTGRYYQVEDNEVSYTSEETSDYLFVVTSSKKTNSSMLPNSALQAYCSDYDGCIIRMCMYHYDANDVSACGMDYNFYYNPINLKYRGDVHGSAVTGTDNDDGETNIIDVGAWHGCYFTDYEVRNSAAQNDGEEGLWLHWSTVGYNDDDKVCVLLMED